MGICIWKVFCRDLVGLSDASSEPSFAEVQVVTLSTPLRFRGRVQFPAAQDCKLSFHSPDVRSKFVQVDSRVSPVRPRHLHGNRYRYCGAWCGLQRKSHDSSGMESMGRLPRSWSQCPSYWKPKDVSPKAPNPKQQGLNFNSCCSNFCRYSPGASGRQFARPPFRGQSRQRACVLRHLQPQRLLLQLLQI